MNLSYDKTFLGKCILPDLHQWWRVRPWIHVKQRLVLGHIKCNRLLRTSVVREYQMTAQETKKLVEQIQVS